MKFKYDLHVHSVLSGCASRENTIHNILNMAKLCDIDFLAITDHNAGLNAIAARPLAERLGIVLVPGVEVATSEDIHVLCYFKSFDVLGIFCSELYDHMYKMPFNTKLYYTQTVLDSDDNDIGCVRSFLGIATDVDLYTLEAAVEEKGGVVVPAHVDKDANSMIATLGCVPEDFRCKAVEVTKFCDEKLRRKLGEKYMIFTNSDAHTLEAMVLNDNRMELREKSLEAFFELFGK